MRELERRDVQAQIDKGSVQIVEVLPAEEFAEDHLPGAINIPLRKIGRGISAQLDPSRPVIVYCWDSA